MQCQECNKNPATVHLTKIINGKKAELHLCETCIKEKEDSFYKQQISIFTSNPLLAGLLNQEPFLTENTQPTYVQCPNCKMTYEQFLKIGKFGCMSCYKAFEKQLSPVFRRIHMGNPVHVGKIPKRAGGVVQLGREIHLLKARMTQEVLAEEFEKAAETRDAIKELERQINDF